MAVSRLAGEHRQTRLSHDYQIGALNISAMAVTVRTAELHDTDAIAHVHVASWRGSYRGIMPDEIIDARSIDLRRAQWAKCIPMEDRITLVAGDEGGSVLGFASVLLLGGSNGGFQSYLQALYLLPEAQRRGIGRRLLRDLSARLHDAGIRNMALRTMRLGSARAFYEHVGARLAPEGITNDAGMFDDVVYAFDDLRALSQ